MDMISVLELTSPPSNGNPNHKMSRDRGLRTRTPGALHAKRKISLFNCQISWSLVVVWLLVGMSMMTSSNGNIFCVTAPLCGEFTGHRWIPPHKGQWRGALMFFFICAWTNDWVYNGVAGDLRRHGAHYGVTVISVSFRRLTGVPVAVLPSRLPDFSMTDNSNLSLGTSKFCETCY